MSGTGMAPYAMPGTDRAYGATPDIRQGVVLAAEVASYELRRDYRDSVWCYAKCSTELAYGATRRWRHCRA
eukprot:472599-Rhodomonas_salina.2